jgi:release factor glutamine methyltransferase
MAAAEPEVWTILRVLDWTRQWFEQKGIASSRADAEVILAHALGLQRVMLYARHDQPLKKEELDQIRALVARRGKGEPVAYLVGEREFWSLPFKVTPAVLIPRPDTEVLVEVALDRARAIGAKRIVDVGTGSGCIAIAIAAELPSAELIAIDTSEDAIALAKENAARHGLAERVRLEKSDLLSMVVGPIDLVAANLPYIPESELEGLMREVRDHEPRSALVPGRDGLSLIRRLIGEAKEKLRPGGAIVLEGGHDQLGSIAALLEESGYEAISVRRDYAGHERVASAIWPR